MCDAGAQSSIDLAGLTDYIDPATHYRLVLELSPEGDFLAGDSVHPELAGYAPGPLLLRRDVINVGDAAPRPYFARKVELVIGRSDGERRNRQSVNLLPNGKIPVDHLLRHGSVARKLQDLDIALLCRTRLANREQRGGLVKLRQ